MSKTFSEKIKEIKTRASQTKDGKMKTTFSKKMFNEVVNALVNDVDYETENIVLKQGKPTKVVSKPVKEFRTKMFTPILKDFKLDDKDIEKIINEKRIELNQTEPMYDLISASIYEFIKTGKSFKFPNKEDFTGSISLRQNPESTYEFKGKKIKKQAHKSLVKKSSCPIWLREDI